MINTEIIKKTASSIPNKADTKLCKKTEIMNKIITNENFIQLNKNTSLNIFLDFIFPLSIYIRKNKF